MGTLGIIAGGGDLPFAVAESARNAGRGVFVVALRGMTDPWVQEFPHEWTALGEAGKTLKLFREHACDDVLLAGKVSRPKWNELKLDTRGAMLLPKVIAAASKGDDALLRSLVSLFEDSGFRVVSVVEAAPDLVAGEGTITRARPSADDEADIVLAANVVRRLGELDVGQAAAVCGGLVLAVEAAEGTDAMIDRVARLPETLKGKPGKPKGVLVKAPKPLQDGKTDLPVIGVATVAGVAAAGLSGIAVQAGGALIVNRRGVIEAADKAGIFVTGFAGVRDPA